MPPRLGRATPEEGRRVPMPLADAGVHGLLDLVGAGAVAPGERPLAEDLPEALDEVEPGSAFGQGHEVEAWRAPVPFQSMVSTLQCSGRASTIREASPSGAKASSRSSKRSHAAVSRVAVVCTSAAPVRCASALNAPREPWRASSGRTWGRGVSSRHLGPGERRAAMGRARRGRSPCGPAAARWRARR